MKKILFKIKYLFSHCKTIKFNQDIQQNREIGFTKENNSI